ncbi:MAG: DUF4835 family protein [Bacteroidetes bacterium]|nr:DUF4835 family protein [Bacteroidota bacterium]
MLKKIISLFIICLSIQPSKAQELQARVSVLAQQIGTSVNPKIFTTLQSQLTDLINNRRWSKFTFQAQEKIQCSFLLNITSVVEDNVYKATLTVQAARPVYNATYQSPLVNYQDAEVTFKYIEYQPIEFNENRVQGTEPLSGNLTATFAFYIYTILGLDFDSFSPKGGLTFFQSAQNIVTNAPDSRNISGWKSFDGSRNRYWLSSNLNDVKYNIIHDIFYRYYRSGMDNLYSNEILARENILDALTKLQNFGKENPGTMILPFFMQNRSDELIGIFTKADPQTKATALQLLLQLDIGNSDKYNTSLK